MRRENREFIQKIGQQSRDLRADCAGHEFAFVGCDARGHDIARIDFMHGLLAGPQEVVNPACLYAQRVEVRDDKGGFVLAGETGHLGSRISAQDEEGNVVPPEKLCRFFETLKQKAEMNGSRFSKAGREAEGHGKGLAFLAPAGGHG